MIREVWKYCLAMQPVEKLSVPQGMRVVHVGEQDGRICLWAECDPTEGAPTEPREYHIVGTGERCDGAEKWHIGTVQLSNGMVFHVYENVAARAPLSAGEEW